MKQVVILSGGGGVGKTTLVAGLTHLAAQEARLVLADVDVDLANLELVLAPTRIAEHDYRGGMLAIIDEDACIACGVCDEICRFGAVAVGDDGFTIVGNACEGCAACVYQCPVEAISTQERMQGIWFHSQTRYGDLFHAHLYAGQNNSGQLVTLVKQKASQWGVDHDVDYCLVDGPRGIAMPTLAACAGAHLVTIVIESGSAALTELRRMLASVQRVDTQVAVVINKYDTSLQHSDAIERFCAAQQVPVLGRIGFDDAVAEALLAGRPVTALDSSPTGDAMRAIWEQIRDLLEG